MLLLGSVQADDRINWPLTQEMFTFLEMLAMVVSESSSGARVCHRRPVGLHRHQRSCCKNSTEKERKNSGKFKSSPLSKRYDVVPFLLLVEDNSLLQVGEASLDVSNAAAKQGMCASAVANRFVLLFSLLKNSNREIGMVIPNREKFQVELRARSHRWEKRAGMKVVLPTLTCQAHVTFPPRFIRYFRWKPCQAGTFPPDKTLYRKYRIERGGQKLWTASRLVFLSFLTLSRGKIGDGKKYSSGSGSLEQFFFSERCRVLSAAFRRLPNTAALAVSKRRADSCQETNGHFFSRQREI